jgi:hypothetical protein
MQDDSLGGSTLNRLSANADGSATHGVAAQHRQLLFSKKVLTLLSTPETEAEEYPVTSPLCALPGESPCRTSIHTADELPWGCSGGETNISPHSFLNKP